jgi:hypothetical protein
VRKSTKENIVAVLACILVLVFVMGAMFLKMEMYGGDPACLFIHCVKVVK